MKRQTQDIKQTVLLEHKVAGMKLMVNNSQYTVQLHLYNMTNTKKTADTHM